MSVSKQSTERIDLIKESESVQGKKTDPFDLNIYAIVPLRSQVSNTIDQNEVLIRKCADAVSDSNYIKKVVLTVDDEKLFSLTDRFSDTIKIIRPKHLSGSDIRLNQVLQYTVEQLDLMNEKPDILLPVEITYPFRPKGIFDRIIEMLVQGNYDTVIAGMPEYRICWKKGKNGFEAVMEPSKPRIERDPLHIGLPSLATAVYPNILREGMRYGTKLGIYEVNDPFAGIEVRTPDELEIVANMFYWPEN